MKHAPTILSFILLVVCNSSRAQTCFRTLNDFRPEGISADGRTLVGESGDAAALCDRDTGVVTLLSSPGPGQASALAISRDGQAIVGRLSSGGTSRPVVWRHGIPSLLESPPGVLSSAAFGVSANGEVILGAGAIGSISPFEDLGFTWRDGPPLPLPLPAGADHGVGYTITPDSELVVGAAFRTLAPLQVVAAAVCWRQGEAPSALTPSWADSLAKAVTPDGRVIAGSGTEVGGLPRPFRWVEGLGVAVIPTPEYPPLTQVDALSISDDGTIITMSAFGPVFQSLLWTPVAGTRPILEVLVEAGCLESQSGEWDIDGPVWVSADGATLAGWARHFGQPVPFAAALPTGLLCYANCDASAAPPILNVNDFVCFFARFAAGDDYANCDLSTTPPTLNVADFVCFLQKFAACD